MKIEIFKDIPWYEWLYQASNLWNIKSLKRIDTNNHPLKERILKPWKTNWYYIVNLCLQWIVKWYKLHRLILLTFIWKSKLIINHRNWIKIDNRLENLEYCTYAYNNKHAYDTWLKVWAWKWKFWKDNHTSKKVNQYTKEWIFIKTWDNIRDVQRKLWINNSNISACCNKKQWFKTAWWYKWEHFNN